MSQENFSSIQSSSELFFQNIIRMFPGGVICCRMEDERFFPDYISKGMMAVCGYTPEELENLMRGDLLHLVCPEDRPQVKAALKSQKNPDFYFRILHKEKGLNWCHVNGTTIEVSAGIQLFCGFFTQMSAEMHLFQDIAAETADAVYVINRENYELLYANESMTELSEKTCCIGQKCYEALYGKDVPCSFCTLKEHAPDNVYHPMSVEENGRFYNTRFREIGWNGIPAYVKYIHDVTEDIRIQREKERLEQYFQTVLRYLPGGVAVVRHEVSGRIVPEFLSDGFADMVGMSREEAWELYMENAMSGVHPEDKEFVNSNIARCIAEGKERYELVYRLQKGGGGYLWVKAAFSVIQSEGEDVRVYVVYHDITEEREAQEQFRQQYENLIFQHYRTPGPDTLILGHCNVTQNKILEIDDYTDSDLLKNFGDEREAFFRGIGSLIVDEKERQAFLGMYLNAPSLAAFERGDTEKILNCYIKLPQEQLGHYAEFKVILVETPDTGDVTGILSVTDITEKTITEHLQYQLMEVSYDLVADVDLFHDRYVIIGGTSLSGESVCGRHSDKLRCLIEEQVIPREKEYVAQRLDTQYILEHLQKEGFYSVSYSVLGERERIYTKRMTVSAVDLRQGRICLAQTDITASVQEQQGLLNMIAYTFELACFIDLDSKSFTMYTREMVLKNLSPHVNSDYDRIVGDLVKEYQSDEAPRQFDLQEICRRLEESPEGYDFMLPYQEADGLHYKQINVLWGNKSHKTICMVRADVTEVMTAERQAKAALEKALEQAEEANHAKSDFLASMSHDIRTPMNAIMGMTSLALAYLDDCTRVEDYLRKISVSSKHLLSLINDILDMSQIEQSKIQLNHVRVVVPEMVEQLKTIMEPQAKNAGLAFRIQIGRLAHPCFMGDALRINQVLINLLGNAFKFTAEGGSVDFCVEEIPAQKNGMVRYQFMVKDTGIGMTEEFKKHLFEPFIRDSKMARVEGTGLGLSITKGLVELMKGTIRVKSGVGEGTTFWIELEGEITDDSKESAVHVSTGVKTEDTVLQGLRILVVEDNAINSEILCELLQMEGAQTTVRENGYLGVTEFRNTDPGTYDVILMDIQMPVLNGLEAARVIRQMDRPDAAAIPIIAMTANAFAEDVRASLESGMNAHVAKPIDIKTLCDAVKKSLNRK